MLKVAKLFIAMSAFLLGMAHGQDGYCSVSQECISIKKCPYTKELFSQVKSTSNPDEKAQLIQAIRLRVCGEPSDRTVCCEIDQGASFSSIGGSNYPRKIGNISKRTFHPLSGELWALDEETLEFRKFVYDGEGPDAFFILGTQTASPDPNLNDAIPLPFYNYEAVPIQKRFYVNDPSIPVLPQFRSAHVFTKYISWLKLLGKDMDGSFRNQTVQLQLPPGLKVSDLQWLSLYCRDFDIDFGNVKF